MEEPSKINKLNLFLIALLFAVGLAVNSFTFYAKVRFFLGGVLNELLIIGIVSLTVYTAFTYAKFDAISITRKLRLALLFIVLIYAVGFITASTAQPEYIPPPYSGSYVMKPNSWSAMAVANIIGIVALICLSICLLILRSLIFYRRKKNTPLYFYLFVFFGGLTMLSAAMSGRPLKYDPSGTNVFTFMLLIVTTIFLVLNIFRVGWVTVLNRRQKFLTFLGGILFTVVTAGLLAAGMGGSNVTLSDMVNSYSLTAGSFLFIMTIFVFFYSITTTANALFHLPTAAIYDKKVKEVNSIYSLSRTINSLFDFEKIVTTVTELVCETTNAQASWLEMANVRNPSQRSQFDFVSLKTRDNFHAHFLEVSSKLFLSKNKSVSAVSPGDLDFRHYLVQPNAWLLQNKQPILINQVKRDKLTKDMKQTPIESLVAVPLISYDEIIGVLYAVKSTQFGFDQDDIAVISAFANQATMAIENSRLFKASLEKERLTQELLIAHEVQMRLIPQQIPLIQNESKTGMLQIGAMTLPANEVGGDYYDFVKLANWRTGIVVGDVSGKGTSAAFYMAEIKGIIQALAGIYNTPSELLIAVNEVLFESMDRKSFITLLYVDFDILKNELRFARAGHCPLLHVSEKENRFIQPSGIGLGLDRGEIFRSTIEDHVIQVMYDDIFVMYSDGLIEARNERGEEFSEERLVASIESARHLDAEPIKDKIISDVRLFVGGAKTHDDMTCVVLKVKNEAKAHAPAAASIETRKAGATVEL
jgi:sigma-B regulation protein RsbU (phosphoserine phosphatase)